MVSVYDFGLRHANTDADAVTSLHSTAPYSAEKMKGILKVLTKVAGECTPLCMTVNYPMVSYLVGTKNPEGVWVIGKSPWTVVLCLIMPS